MFVALENQWRNPVPIAFVEFEGDLYEGVALGLGFGPFDDEVAVRALHDLTI